MIRRNLLAAFAVFGIIAAAAIENTVNAQSVCNFQTNSNNVLVLGLTADMRLVCFSESGPGRVSTIAQVTGLGGDSALIGMDYRVQDGRLYGVGNAGGVYTINTNTGVATLVNNLTIPLEGSSFGVDFNPAADRLRVISNTGQNLRHNVNAGGVTINDGTLTYTAPPAAAAAALGVTGAAYTNNDLDANTATTLFDIDSALVQVAIQSPANNGILAATGKLGVTFTDSVGFDIYSSLQTGTTVNNRGYAVLTSTGDGFSRFYSVSLLTGRATLTGFIGAGSQVVDIAIPLNQ